MVGIPYSAGLHRLTERTYAYLRPPGSWGFSNCGLVVDGGKGLLVDTQFDLPSTQRLISALEQVVSKAEIGTVVTTHANGDHCWGNQLLPDAVIVGSAATARGVLEEFPPHALAALAASPPGQSCMGDYMRRFFGHFDFSRIVLTPPTQTFTGDARVVVGQTAVELREVGPAHTTGDVIVSVPSEGVVFAGDILFINDHPVMWTGPVANWIAACDRIADTEARFIVPGHGPVTDVAGVLVFRDYLSYVADRAVTCFDQGLPYWEAARMISLPSPFAEWGHRERLVLTFAAIYRGLGYDGPTDLVTGLGHMARFYQDLSAVTRE